MKTSVFFVYVIRTAKELNITIEDAIKLIKKMGYDMVEFDIAELNAFDTAYALCTANGMSVSSVYGECENEQDIYRLVDKAVECKSPVAMVLPKQKFKILENVKEELDNSIYAQNFVKILKNGVAYAQKCSISLTLECYGKENISSKTNCLNYLFEKVSGLKHTYDSGNFYLNGEDGLVALRKFKDITIHVHLKDYLLNPRLNDESFSYEKIATAVGSGQSGIDKIINELKRIGYTGAYTVEYLGVENTYLAIKNSIEWLKTIK